MPLSRKLLNRFIYVLQGEASCKTEVPILHKNNNKKTPKQNKHIHTNKGCILMDDLIRNQLI